MSLCLLKPPNYFGDYTKYYKKILNSLKRWFFLNSERESKNNNSKGNQKSKKKIYIYIKSKSDQDVENNNEQWKRDLMFKS